MSLCQYKDILGKPYEGVHRPRVCGLAAADVVGTVGLAAAASYATGYQFAYVLIFIFMVATFLHWLFCVPTAFAVWVGLV
jgi:hypothetical protein